MIGLNLLRQDVLFNSSDDIGLSYEDFEILAYIFKKTETPISNIWHEIEISPKLAKESLDKLEKNRLVLKIIDKKGDKVHLTEKGLLLTLLLDTYSMYAPAAENGEPVVGDLISYLHMLKIPFKEERLGLAKQIENIAMELLKKSEDFKKQTKEVS